MERKECGMECRIAVDRWELISGHPRYDPILLTIMSTISYLSVCTSARPSGTSRRRQQAMDSLASCTIPNTALGIVVNRFSCRRCGKKV